MLLAVSRRIRNCYLSRTLLRWSEAGENRLESMAALIDTIRGTVCDAVTLAGVDLPVVSEQIPVQHFSEALDLVGAAPDA